MHVINSHLSLSSVITYLHLLEFPTSCCSEMNFYEIFGRDRQASTKNCHLDCGSDLQPAVGESIKFICVMAHRILLCEVQCLYWIVLTDSSCELSLV